MVPPSLQPNLQHAYAHPTYGSFSHHMVGQTAALTEPSPDTHTLSYSRCYLEYKYFPNRSWVVWITWQTFLYIVVWARFSSYQLVSACKEAYQVKMLTIKLINNHRSSNRRTCVQVYWLQPHRKSNDKIYQVWHQGPFHKKGTLSYCWWTAI